MPEATIMTTMLLLCSVHTEPMWTDKLMAISSALSVVGIAVPIIWKTRIEHQKEKRELFDKRLTICRQLLERERGRDRSIPPGLNDTLLLGLKQEAQYLLSPSTVSALSDYSNMFYACAKAYALFEASDELNKTERFADFIRIADEANASEARLNLALEKELRLIHNRPPLWQTIETLIDRLEAEMAEDARKRMRSTS